MAFNYEKNKDIEKVITNWKFCNKRLHIQFGSTINKTPIYIFMINQNFRIKVQNKIVDS